MALMVARKSRLKHLARDQPPRQGRARPRAAAGKFPRHRAGVHHAAAGQRRRRARRDDRRAHRSSRSTRSTCRGSTSTACRSASCSASRASRSSRCCSASCCPSASRWSIPNVSRPRPRCRCALLTWLATPFAFFLIWVTRGLLRMLRMNSGTREHVSEEEIRLLVAEGADQGVIDSDERNMVNRVLRLGDRTVDSVMTPRTRIAWLDASAVARAQPRSHARDAVFALSGLSRRRAGSARRARSQTPDRPDRQRRTRPICSARCASRCTCRRPRARSICWKNSATPKPRSRSSSTNTATSKAWSR